tara:strand:- start:4809 stop:5372 length:564 start_codon:yes stop_codon:yes gene_type:complete
MATIKDFKYKLVKNFLTKEEVDIAKKYILIRHRFNRDSFDFVQNNNCDTSFYDDPFCEALLYNKLKLMEKETGLQLFPTYSFSRVYSYNADLKKHKDRPSCEISVTVMFGSDGTEWPIYMEGKPINMEAGDACIYLGCDLLHERKPFEGDWHAQCFLHYVDQNGPFAKYKYDSKNPSLHETFMGIEQ